jgi:hypothetical protein
MAKTGMAKSRRGAEEKGRRATHNNQLNKDNAVYNNKAPYNVNEHDGEAAYDNDVTIGVTIGLGNSASQTTAKTPAQRRLHIDGNNTSAMLVTTPTQPGGVQECNESNNASAVTATMPAECWQQRGQQCQRNNGGEVTMGTASAKQ